MIVKQVFVTFQKSGGLDPSTAARVLVFQKALTSCGLPAEDVVRALLMQTALAANGVSSKNILAAVVDIVSSTFYVSLTWDGLISILNQVSWNH